MRCYPYGPQNRAQYCQLRFCSGDCYNLQGIDRQWLAAGQFPLRAGGRGESQAASPAAAFCPGRLLTAARTPLLHRLTLTCDSVIPSEYASRALSGPAKYLVCSKVFSRAKIWCPVKVGLVCFFLWMLSPRGSGAGGRKGEVSRMSGGASLWR